MWWELDVCKSSSPLSDRLYPNVELCVITFTTFVFVSLGNKFYQLLKAALTALLIAAPTIWKLKESDSCS